MLVGKQNKKARPLQRMRVRTAEDVVRRQRRGVVVAAAAQSAGHPFTSTSDNERLYQYESNSKQAFDNIEAVLRQIAQYQHRVDFVSQAQHIAQQELGLSIPEAMLGNTWVAPLDMKAIYAWCVFETFQRFADEFYTDQPLAHPQDQNFQSFLESCGFHLFDISPCSDGRLAHAVRYVLRLPYKNVRRKSYAGAMFDVEDSIQKWIKIEHLRYRESQPNAASDPTRYLKAAMYHYSSSQPDVEGCAAHGSDPVKAAAGALDRLEAFRQGVENSFCCGASIDLMLIGIDTDNDTIRIHIPDASGHIDGERYIDAGDVYNETRRSSANNDANVVAELVKQKAEEFGVQPAGGMVRMIARLIVNNISQIDYVRRYFNGSYADVGHQERFIGMGVGFEEVQLRNLTYFAYLKTVEQGAKDLDVGIKIFTGLNIKRGLPAPVVIRYDYHGNVPGERDRAVARCECLDAAMRKRFPEQAEKGLLHTLLVIRDCNADNKIEVVGSSVTPEETGGHH